MIIAACPRVPTKYKLGKMLYAPPVAVRESLQYRSVPEVPVAV